MRSSRRSLPVSPSSRSRSSATSRPSIPEPGVCAALRNISSMTNASRSPSRPEAIMASLARIWASEGRSSSGSSGGE
ncbi:hypothetical protein ACFQ0B_08560 [Nonomuraea thailandensis]